MSGLYIAYLPAQNGYLVWSQNENAWRATTDKTLATVMNAESWASVNLTAKFKLVKP